MRDGPARRARSSSRDFVDGRRHLARAAYDAYDDLASRFDVVVAEGAGSPAEINLRASDYVNMGLARHAGMPTVVVGDIDRGGVFAAMFGTVALLDAGRPAAGRRVRGQQVPRRRRRCSSPGSPSSSALTGRPRATACCRGTPTCGWTPRTRSTSTGRRAGRRAAARKVAVVRLPRISNFTDVDALGLEPDLDVVFASDPRDLADADLVVLPGTRATDRRPGVAAVARASTARSLDHAAAGRPVLGICGGFQMLGRAIARPARRRGRTPGASVDGLGLLDVDTEFAAEKVLRLPAGRRWAPARATRSTTAASPSATARSSSAGARRAGVRHDVARQPGGRRVPARRSSPRSLGARRRRTASFPAARERRLDLLGDLVEEHLDVDALLALAVDGPPAGLPLLPPGAVR